MRPQAALDSITEPEVGFVGLGEGVRAAVAVAPGHVGLPVPALAVPDLARQSSMPAGLEGCWAWTPMMPGGWGKAEREELLPSSSGFGRALAKLRHP